MSCVVISSVANPSSKVNLLATTIAKSLSTHVLNIAERNLPLCDGYTCYKDKDVIRLQEQISAADSFILCSPVYCYDINAILKNFIELCGAQLKKKVVGIAVSAGGSKSYMAPMNLIQALMLDSRCYVVPRYVYAVGDDYDSEEKIFKPELTERLDALATAVTSLSNALKTS